MLNTPEWKTKGRHHVGGLGFSEFLFSWAIFWAELLSPIVSNKYFCNWSEMWGVGDFYQSGTQNYEKSPQDLVKQEMLWSDRTRFLFSPPRTKKQISEDGTFCLMAVLNFW